MESSIFRFIIRYSRKEQILLLVFTLSAFPFLYMSLDLPKTIINQAIGGREFPRDILNFQFDQIPYLLVLCSIFLLLVFINGGFKYFINLYRGVVGERMLRRLRYQLYGRVLRFPLPSFRKLSQGEIVSMITAETEPLGGFIGDSVALPAFQGGTLLTILAFMFVQDPVLGTAAVALYPVQAYFIPKLQRKLNLLKKERVIHVRRLSERIGEVVTGVREVHAHDTSQYELADFSDRAGDIYEIRVKIYKQKFLIKFLNNFIAQVTPFFFYFIGGYLVIRGNLSFGALVAVLAAYKDLASPWKELLDYYQNKEDARVKYDLLYEIFEPPGMLDARLLSDEAPDGVVLEGELLASNLNLNEADEGEGVFSGGLTLKLSLPKFVAVVGGSTSGKDRFAATIAGIKRPLSGALTIDGFNLSAAPESITGRRAAYVGREPLLRAGSLRENLFYSLCHRPVSGSQIAADSDPEHARKRREAELSGNSPYDFNANWVDPQNIGIADADALIERAMDVLRAVCMDQDIHDFGLNGVIDPEDHPQLSARVLEARAELKDRLVDPEIAPLVDLFDKDAYNTNMSVAENLLFGTPKEASFYLDNLPDNEYVRKVLQETGLMDDFVGVGRKLAALMVDLFADVEPGSELFEQFSFISADDLPEFRSLLSRTERTSYKKLEQADLRMLLSLPFKLVPARHRLGLIDKAMQRRLLEARKALAMGIDTKNPPIEFFDPECYNPSVSIQDNILFGRLAYGKARSAVRIGKLIGEVVDKLGLRRAIMEAGLDFQIGISGSRLSGPQRQKLSIARCVLKRPDILVVDEATAALDEATQKRILENLLLEFKGRTLIWFVHRASLGREFEQILVMEGGRVVEQGAFEELDRPGTVFRELAAAS
jgi:ABC-type multidrug transport system fused ATPase/permease subunit